MSYEIILQDEYGNRQIVGTFDNNFIKLIKSWSTNDAPQPLCAKTNLDLQTDDFTQENDCPKPDLFYNEAEAFNEGYKEGCNNPKCTDHYPVQNKGELCKHCGHLKSEHTKAYEEDLEEGEKYGRPCKCLVIGCGCKGFIQNKSEVNSHQTKSLGSTHPLDEQATPYSKTVPRTAHRYGNSGEDKTGDTRKGCGKEYYDSRINKETTCGGSMGLLCSECQQDNDYELIKNLMSDEKKRGLSEVSEELDIHPRKVKEVFNKLDSEGYWDDDGK